MIKSIPRLLLFDIDGTLTKSTHINLGNCPASSLLEALSIVFKQNFGRNGINFAGNVLHTATNLKVLYSGDIFLITPFACPFLAKLHPSLFILLLSQLRQMYNK